MNDDTLTLYYYNDGLSDQERRDVEKALRDDAELAARYRALRRRLETWSDETISPAPGEGGGPDTDGLRGPERRAHGGRGRWNEAPPRQLRSANFA